MNTTGRQKPKVQQDRPKSEITKQEKRSNSEHVKQEKPVQKESPEFGTPKMSQTQ